MLYAAYNAVDFIELSYCRSWEIGIMSTKYRDAMPHRHPAGLTDEEIEKVELLVNRCCNKFQPAEAVEHRFFKSIHRHGEHGPIEIALGPLSTVREKDLTLMAGAIIGPGMQKHALSATPEYQPWCRKNLGGVISFATLKDAVLCINALGRTREEKIFPKGVDLGQER